MTNFRKVIGEVILVAMSVFVMFGQNAPVTGPPKDMAAFHHPYSRHTVVGQNIFVGNDTALACTNEQEYSKDDGFESDRLVNKFRCIVQIRIIPEDSKFEFYFDDGSVITMDKSQLIKLVQSQPKSKK